MNSFHLNQVHLKTIPSGSQYFLHITELYNTYWEQLIYHIIHLEITTVCITGNWGRCD